MNDLKSLWTQTAVLELIYMNDITQKVNKLMVHSRASSGDPCAMLADDIDCHVKSIPQIRGMDLLKKFMDPDL